MKKLIVILSIAFGLIQTSKAQGNLQFNKIVTIDFRRVLNNFADGADTILSVPSNKIWKIESVSSSMFADSTNISIKGAANYIATSVFLNNNLLIGSAGTSQHYAMPNFPIYLESSKTFTLGVRPSANASVSFPASFGCFVSIVEFNIVP